MQADVSQLPEEPIPPTPFFAEWFRALWHLFVGLGGGMLPLILVTLFFSIGWIQYNLLGGQCANCNNGHGLPLFFVMVGFFGVVCVATLACLLFRKTRVIGAGLLLGVLLTVIIVALYVNIIPSSMD
jgi:hypothetical protein